MRFGYFIAVHRNIDQFQWTFSAVYYESDTFVIHVDRKAGLEFRDAIQRVVAPYKNVHLIRSQSVAWGSWSFCSAELEGLRKLLSVSNDWSYYINLSGQCYPVKPIADIRRSLESAWPKNFIGAVPFHHIAETEPNDPHLKRPIVFEVGGRIRFTGAHWPPNPLVKFKGSTWHILSRPFCEWIFNSRALRSIPWSLKYTFTPDELLFQSLIMSSPYQDAINPHYGREVIWPGPKVLTFEDWKTLTGTPAFFARKFDCHRDEQVLRSLSETSGFNQPMPLFGR